MTDNITFKEYKLARDIQSDPNYLDIIAFATDSQKLLDMFPKWLVGALSLQPLEVSTVLLKVLGMKYTNMSTEELELVSKFVQVWPKLIARVIEEKNK